MQQSEAEKALRDHIKLTRDVSLVNNSNILMPLYAKLGERRFYEICREEGYDLDKYSNNAAMVYAAIMQLNQISETEQRKLSDLLTPNEPREIGEFLLAHLRLEHIIDKIIDEHAKATNVIKPPDKIAYNFADKVRALPPNILLDQVTINAIKGINTLRNKYVHNIQFDITTFEHDGITRAIRNQLPATAKERYTTIMNLVSRIEGILLLQVPSLSPELAKIFDQYPAMKILLEALRQKDYKDIHEAFWKM